MDLNDPVCKPLSSFTSISWPENFQDCFPNQGKGWGWGGAGRTGQGSASKNSVCWERLPDGCEPAAPLHRSQRTKRKGEEIKKILEVISQRNLSAATPSPFISVHNSAKLQTGFAMAHRAGISPPVLLHATSPACSPACRGSVCSPQVTACLSEDEQTNSK